MDLPPWVSEEEDRPAPMPLLRVQSFINTLDIGTGTDLLRDPDVAREWLGSAGLIGERRDLSDGQLNAAREAREALRALVALNGAGPQMSADQVATLQRVAGSRRPAVNVDADGNVSLRPREHGDLADGLLELLLTVRDAQADGTWARLKVCANRDCEWAFYDRSRNRQGSWCSMATCGNRLKNRRFRARAAPGRPR